MSTAVLMANVLAVGVVFPVLARLGVYHALAKNYNRRLNSKIKSPVPGF